VCAIISVLIIVVSHFDLIIITHIHSDFSLFWPSSSQLDEKPYHMERVLNFDF